MKVVHRNSCDVRVKKLNKLVKNYFGYHFHFGAEIYLVDKNKRMSKCHNVNEILCYFYVESVKNRNLIGNKSP